MCGLSGEIRFDGSLADTTAVARMVECLVPRGPDGQGAWSNGRVAFGHRRLSVIDLSPAGSQPMVDNELGLTAVFNGCIYDYKELRAELEGHGYRFFSTSDTEVILKGYHHWGTAVVEHLHGMFAFVITERDTGRVVLARDRLGIKPLYLAETPGRLRFASSLPALVQAGDVDTSIDPVALHHYLTWHAVVPAPRTILNGVRKLPPATVRVVEADGTSREHRYWEARYERRPEHANWSARDWEDAIEEALRVAVRRRLVADIPVGVLLSGGLDSSLIVGLLAQEGQTGLATYSIGFEAVGGREGDEFVYSDVIAERFSTDHHRIRVASDELAAALGHAIGAMAEPMVSHDVVAFDLLSERVSQSIRVVQSGQGADEVFAGYHWYPPLQGVDRERAVETYAKAFFDRDAADTARLVADRYAVDGDPSLEFVRRHMSAPHADTAVDAALRLDSEVMLVDDPVKRVDNMSMAWGLEARVPFLDHDLVELAAMCPPELKLADGGKGVLKAIGRRIIPPEVIDRPKGYFPVPAITHLEGKVLDLVRDALSNDAARERGLFRPEYVDRLLADPNGGLTPLRGNKLWQLGLLELWLQAHGV
ncbi:N-acetylglutaminylglutamine amidotransferase [Geodermatophilus poikilotrophus]|uniref:asparagine synthase (glutamine-hydrolyzing) n=1 Tax=Geodermatophilus poikilotrophus TaxID=1333667 RepID=A0A1I0GHU3_9ACTN|nr:N-acetylglutaminylglutamine amidotransferase [Geodermatophilus poikilotrophus]SET70513.1 asparagine synthase (glutamine-hydrolysing) [Geodermatophilus poikilotrophus]